ncbi:MAG: hypothetical protein ACQEXN_13750 [Actinomycetota bacterium]
MLVSVITVFLIGFLTIQVAGVRGGAVFGIDNQLVAITEPNPGFLQLLAIAAVGGASVAVLALAGRNRSARDRSAVRSGFVAATLIQVAVSAFLTAQGSTVPNLNQPQPRWVEGWVTDGGMNSAVHLILIVAGYLLLSNRSVAEKEQSVSTDAGLDTE